MFIQTEATPDPARLKFLPGRVVLAEGVLNLPDKTQAAASPLAERLFAIPEISAVFLGSDSITVTKVGGNWQLLKPVIIGAIMEHFLSEAPVLRQGKEAKRPSSSRPTEGDPDLVDRIREALRQVIDPEIGYNIFDLGLVYDIAVEEGGVVGFSVEGKKVRFSINTKAADSANLKVSSQLLKLAKSIISTRLRFKSTFAWLPLKHIPSKRS